MKLYGKILSSWLKHWDFILLDMLFLQAAYIFSFFLRNGFINLYANKVYLNIGIIICFVDICTAFFLEDYKGIMQRGYFLEFKAVIKHVFAVCVFVISYLFLSKNSEEFSRVSFVSFSISAIIILYIERVLWKWHLLKHKKIYYKQKALLIFTDSDIAEKVIKNVKDHSYNELNIIGIVLRDRDDLIGCKIEGEEIVCSKDEMLDYIQTKWLDGILINLFEVDNITRRLVAECVKMGVTAYIIIPEIGEEFGYQRLEKVGGYAVVSAAISSASPSELFIKRVMDICGAGIGLFITGILCLFIAPAIYLSSPGPIFFSQVRIGKNGRKFKIYKFRSMYLDAEEKKKELIERNQMQGQIFKVHDDPRIIGSGPDGKRHGVGWFLRRTSIDEFPQFWNIMRGDMSLVGTRPPTVDEWEKYEHHHRGRLAMKPGLTGLWQVSGRNSITDFEEVVKMDMKYIQNWNLGLDIKIIFKTIWVVLSGEGSG